MPARLNPYPAYMIYDRSFSETVTTVGTDDFVNLVTGNVGLSRDGDITTAYTCSVQRNNSPSTGGLTTLFTFPLLYLNCQLSYKIKFTNSSAIISANAVIEYSEDGISWTNLSNDNFVSTLTKTNSLVAFGVKYFRVHFESTANPQTLTIDFYEVRLMGSGN